MKSIYTLVLCLGWLTLMSQDETVIQNSKFDRHQVGINLISLLDRINKPKVDAF